MELVLTVCFNQHSGLEDSRQNVSKKPGPADLEAIRSRVRTPATFMIALAISCIALTLTGLALILLGNTPDFIDKLPPIIKHQIISRGILGNAILMAGNIVILIGALKMRRCQSFWMALTASTLCIFFDSGYFCTGLIIGIWAIVSLIDKPEVKTAFNTTSQKDSI